MYNDEKIKPCMSCKKIPGIHGPRSDPDICKECDQQTKGKLPWRNKIYWLIFYIFSEQVTKLITRGMQRYATPPISDKK